MNQAQHFAAVIHALEERLKAKTLEAASLKQLREAAPGVIQRFYSFRNEEVQKPVQDAVFNYLTAKLNSAVLDMKDLEMNLDALRRQSSPIALPTLQAVPTRQA